MYHVTYQLRLVLNAFFCSLFCVRIYDTSCIARFVFFSLNQKCAVSEFIVEQINQSFSTILECF